MESSTTPTTTRNFEKQDLLRLFLGLNDKFRMPPGAWEFLPIRDLMACASLSKDIWQQLGASTVEYTRCRDGKDYLVPFPGFPGLLSTPDDLHQSAGLFPHQLASLHAMHRLEHSNDHFGSLRGGILGDAPGLGKTITMLALIANTAGRRPVPPPEFWDASGIAEGWKNMRANEEARKDFLTALKPIRNWVQSCIVKNSPYYKKFQELARYISPPFTDDRFPTIRDLELHVYRELREFVPRAQFELFRSNMIDIKAGLDKGNRKLIKGPMGRRLQQERKLIPSSATLIIVPDALLEHWFQQIHMHLHLSRFADQNDPGIRNICYVDGIGDFADTRLPLRQTKSGLQVPPAYILAQYFIVVTTFSRCKAEFEQQVRTGRMGAAPASSSSSSRTSSRKRQHRQFDAFGAPSEDPTINASPFFQVRWLRIVVDEGHELGTHEAATGVTQFIHEIAAERRWVLSGTPTTGDEDDKQFSSHALDQLQRLLVFLRHPMYGNLPSETSYITDADEYETNKDQAKKQWLTKVKTPFLSKKREGRSELERVLTNCLVMHRKEDIKLPKPIFRQAEVDVPVPEPIQVEMRENVESALTILDKYLHSNDYQWIVDEAQAKFIIETLRKAKEDLKKRGGALRNMDGGGIADYEHMDLSDDRRPIKAVVYSRDNSNLLSVTEVFYRTIHDENIAELYDSTEAGSMGAELSRFRHNFKEIRVCPICQRENNLAAFDGRAPHRCRNTLLEVVGETASGQPVRFLVEPERIVRALLQGEGGTVHPTRMDGHSVTSYNKHQKFWKVGDILEVDVRGDHPLLPTRWSDAQWLEYGANKCFDRARENNFEGSDWYFGPLPPTEQRRNTTMAVKLAKWQQCGKFHNHARWYDGPRLSDAPIRKVDEDVFLLSLHAGLSHGLDLSFVTHMFLLEPIEDAALLEQVTSRAHRLGTKGPVRVETVNTFYNVSEETEQKMEKAAWTEGASAKKTLLEEKAKALKRICCIHCFRGFDSYALAEHHEQTNCPRNPEIESTVDPFHLSSVYREIKPPPAAQAKTPATVLLSAH